MSTPETEILIIRETIPRQEAHRIGAAWYKDMVKGVVDVEEEIVALGGEWHMDANVVLMDDGSSQDHVWGFNIYPERVGNDWIEYISLINIRPALGNKGMEVLDPALRDRMKAIIEKRIV